MPKIAGNGWEIWLNEDCYIWEFSGDGREIARMLSGEFPGNLIYESYRDRYITIWGTKFGPLYEDAIEFLSRWGVKCHGVDLPEMAGETGPSD